MRVSSATSSQITSAVNFCVGQIGKDYSLDLSHDTSSGELDWYCSELVWAAYKNQGIELETVNQLPGITPYELLDSTKTASVAITTLGTPSVRISSTGTTKVTLSWSAISGATEYDVYRSTSVNGAYSYIGSTTGTTFSETSLTSGTVYYYRVAACKNSTEGNKSDPKCLKTTFAAPTIQTAYAVSSEVTLGWNAVSEATSYKVYRATGSSSGTYSLVATVTTTTFTDSNTSADTSYYYKISAVKNGATSSLSSYRGIKTLSLIAPIIYFIDSGDAGVQLKWTQVPGATGYKVYRAYSSNQSSYSLVATVPQEVFFDTGVSSGTTYCYKVVAYSGSKTSPYSTVSYITT